MTGNRDRGDATRGGTALAATALVALAALLAVGATLAPVAADAGDGAGGSDGARALDGTAGISDGTARRPADAPSVATHDAPSVATHGNHVTVSRQVVGDGTVVVEQLFVLQDGWVAIHVDDGGEPGRVIGHRRIAGGLHSNLDVPTNESFWASTTGNVTLWAVLHLDDGDGVFEPSADTVPPSGVGGYPRMRFAARAGSRGGVVVPYAGNATYRTTGNRLTIRRADLPADGYLVLRSNTADQRPGPVVGTTRLSAGHHENVTVALNRSFYDEASTTPVLYAQLWRGNGSFDPETATPLTVDGRAVGTRFSVRKRAADSTDDGIDVVTATATATRAPTTSASGESGGPADESTGTTDAPGDPGSPTPGPGVPGATLALALGVALGIAADRRRRSR